MVRPWALASPILILLIALPLLRPLRHPDPAAISDDELARLATIQSLVEHRTLAIDDTAFVQTDRKIRVGEHLYSDQMPVMATLLAVGYWLMHQAGLNLRDNSILVPYLLTVLAVTLPVAGAAGMVYRMGRLFELRRPWRAALALSVVLASGLISYAVVLNPHAPAAVLILASAACLIHVAHTKSPARCGGWVAIAGFCASLAAVIDLSAAVFAVLLFPVVFAFRWRTTLQLSAAVMYLIGMTPPILLHAALTVPLTGDVLPGFLHPELAAGDTWQSSPIAPADGLSQAPAAPAIAVNDLVEEDDGGEFGHRDSLPNVVMRNTGRVLAALLGPHGLFSHFPIILLGIGGVMAVMHRHWPSSTKTLAAATLAGGVVIVLACALARPADWPDAMFATRWYIVFLPLTLFWAGAWLRRSHHPIVWTSAAVLLVFSTTVSLIGATNPYPKAGFDRYTAAEAVRYLLQPDSSKPPVLAGG